MKILDCTLREGGYYTNWDFEKKIVQNYSKSMQKLPIDFIEIGYRNPKLKGYYGEYYYCKLSTIEFIQQFTNKNLAIILNEKDVDSSIIHDLINPIYKKVDLIRMAVNPINISGAIKKAEIIKKMGFNVAFNVMYMSKWNNYNKLFLELSNLDGVVDYFYMVDSFGGVFPETIKATINKIKSISDIKIGFHGHNNLELSLINTLTAIEEGVDIVDSTITGMGRGAGNLKTELLLTVLNKMDLLNVDMNSLTNTTNDFYNIQKKYNWGTSLPFMVSGSNNLPQKDVMSWMGKGFYSLNTIVQALANKKSNIDDNLKLPEFKSKISNSKVLIVGGGPSVKNHINAIIEILNKNTSIILIHASSKNSHLFKNISNEQFFCLVGDEGTRLVQTLNVSDSFEHICITPQYPRKMGTHIPNSLLSNSFELSNKPLDFDLKDTHLSVSLDLSIILDCSVLYLVGYDGYKLHKNIQQEIEIFNDNNKLFDLFFKKYKIKPKALTPTEYNIEKQSIYSIL